MWTALTLDTWLSRQQATLTDVTGAVQNIIDEVTGGGDEALFDLCERFDKIRLDHLRVSEDEIDEAYESVDPEIVEALTEAFSRIWTFHELQRQKDLWFSGTEDGITLGVKTTPLERIGMYVPGGRAAYPSTVLMCAVPAQVAGVNEIICCTPPPANPLTLVAADIAGVTDIYTVGGAQAIAAMALGTDTIRPVQKIVGPGNAYVTAAKMMLRGRVEIDFPAGPSEIAIIADHTARPDFVAADILAQSEHDPQAASVLITTDPSLPAQVGDWIERLVAEAPRQEIIRQALDQSGYLVVNDIADAIATSDKIAPEHLSIQVQDPLPVLQKVRNAGSIFVGQYAPVACGDYASGTNHVLPTAGNAKLYSGLNVSHFTKTSTVQIISREGIDAIGDVVERLATAEGLHAHAASSRIRREI
ncbi:MAG TPA: histidinol dehydrogenase [Methanospirillum sp.]|uniref:histidinol dehydrogenase n=1 Tax=Methanospirillum sp. TaxID=45200 RepID=UPI002BF1CBAC|nr:histidinol dehydrogenase [Methanospirillum sp.]HWQ64431.1 histidinol dehydrogenase [Methanospirillum sp.]